MLPAAGKKLAIALLTALALAASGLSALAQGERIQLGNLLLNVDARFGPTSLPTRSYAPIGISGRAEIGTIDGSLPSALAHVVVDWDRNGRLTTVGLPRCDPARIEQATTEVARRVCGPALVGTGSFRAEIARPGQAPLGASSVVLIFNAVPDHGNPRFLLQAYAYLPAPTAFVIPVEIAKIHSGRYGYRSTLDIPSIAGGNGVLTHFDFQVRRRYRFRGRRLSVISARCPDQRLQIAGTITFADGDLASGSIVHGCQGRPWRVQTAS